MDQNFIRVTVVYPQGAARYLNEEPTLHFTFLHWQGPNEPNAEGRFEQMATLIRHRMRNMYNITDHQMFPMLVDIIPAEQEVDVRHQRAFHSLSVITQEAFTAIFTAMLQSQETLQIEGLTISVRAIGRSLRSVNASGRARPFGTQSIPKHLKDSKVRGIGNHPDTKHKHILDRLNEIGLCGPRAILLSRNPDIYLKDYNKWINDAIKLGEDLDLNDGIMQHKDIRSLLKMPAWREYRIIIFNHSSKIDFLDSGKDWKWQENQDREIPDPFTISIFYDRIEQHYWWIQLLKTFAFRHRTDISERKDCFYCFKQFKATDFQAHNCNIHDAIQCTICKDFFIDKEQFADHLSKQNKDYPPCECCGKSMFYGSQCFNRHKKTNCSPPVSFEKKVCEICEYTYSTKYEHNCRDFGNCRLCELTFENHEQRKWHRCYLKSNPIDKLKHNVSIKTDKKTKYTSHWFYDFETCRAKESDENRWQHEVMAWCIKFIQLDDEEKAIFEEFNIKSKMVQELEALPRGVFLKYRFDFDGDGSIRIWGKDLPTFLKVCEKVLFLRDKTFDMKPILWAHNGSKFDVKFILDYYLNVENLDLAGQSYTQDFKDFIPQKENDEIKWIPESYSSKRDICSISSVGSKVLSLKARNVTFRCSYAHFSRPLRALPAMFGFSDEHLKKGEFPYGRLSHDAWGTFNHNGLPDLIEYDIDAMTSKRRTETLKWWFKEQVRRNAHSNISDQVLEFDEQFFDNEASYIQDITKPTVAWGFDQELWGYLFADVDVGAEAMRQYHLKAKEMQLKIPHNKDQVFISPLSCSTTPGWALKIYLYWFMPEESIGLLKPKEALFIKEALHGGRTDKRANIVSISDERLAAGDTMQYYDFKSLYPSVQKCITHDTHFPVGPPEYCPAFRNRPMTNEKLIDLMTKMNRTGFLQVDTTHLKYSTHPTLCKLGSWDEDENQPKLLFPNADMKKEIYAWPELEEAIRCGEVEVTFVHDSLLFMKGDNIFNGYVDFFFQVKDDAEADGNEGLRSLAKMLLNSLWGKLGQRSYATTEWVYYTERLKYLMDKFDSGEYEMISCIPKEDDKVWFKYRVKEDFNNLKVTALHVASFVSMWGRVTLHKKLLQEHGQRALYCDTDSGIIYKRQNDSIPFVGKNLGDLTNELPKILQEAGYSKHLTQDAYIREAVFVAPKTYSLHIQTPNGINYFKTVCKGFEPSYKNSKKIQFESMKQLVSDKYNLGKRKINEVTGVEEPPLKCIKDDGNLRFTSSLARNAIVPTETILFKALSGKYNKGKIHPSDTRLIIPFGQFTPQGSFLNFENNKHFN